MVRYYPSLLLDTKPLALSRCHVLPRQTPPNFSGKTACIEVKAKLPCGHLMKNIVRYHILQNLKTPIQNRISLADRVARQNSVRVGRDYAMFRMSLNIVSKED